ncbi:MAG: thioredoxin [Candidatus Omnitrophica bacterium]|nr:thioredoxin [Candidatus Omnitrophota bacterium]
MAHIIEATDATFANEIATNELVLIDFWASWCGPCKRLTPVIDELSQRYQGKLKVIKIDVDNNQTITEKYEIISLPTLLFIKNGECLDTVTGFVPKATIIEKIESLL